MTTAAYLQAASNAFDGISEALRQRATLSRPTRRCSPSTLTVPQLAQTVPYFADESPEARVADDVVRCCGVGTALRGPRRARRRGGGARVHAHGALGGGAARPGQGGPPRRGLQHRHVRVGTRSHAALTTRERHTRPASTVSPPLPAVHCSVGPS